SPTEHDLSLRATFALSPHVRAAAGHTEPIDPPAAGRLWNNLGYHLRDIADYAGAWAALERALGIKEAIYEPDHPSIATTVNNLGLVLQDLGDLTGARAAFERALGIFWNPSADV
ncbi:MAG TPA: tetratricopeptide repeat protein, partial [Anaerolineae bacterium]|nr:tetratricopeptide repeat protein [Anaerolineae bacterium]